MLCFLWQYVLVQADMTVELLFTCVNGKNVV